MMLDMFEAEPPTEAPYGEIYRSLREIREVFHREGRISDANAKLDETVKLLALHYGFIKGLISESEYMNLMNQSTFKVSGLNSAFKKVAGKKPFIRKGIGSIFGPSPSTIFEHGDEKIAYELLRTSGLAFEAQRSRKYQLDILNEAFSHHIRDNFRNHIEDAQYMTPTEVVSFMTELAIELLKPRINGNRITVSDPSCGVGSFLTQCRSSFEKAYGRKAGDLLKCVGQDKADRMVRMSAINLILSDSSNDDVFMGNSVQDESPISKYDGEVDLILTNPPFGAKFGVDSLKASSAKSTPFFANRVASIKTIDSELLFIDRYLTLLRPGGLCLAVVPDGVVSAKGTSSVLRQHLSNNAEILCVIELPPVTFAQAGTRTKTVILGFRKIPPKKSYPIFFSEVDDIGFQVSKRKGLLVKKPEGVNELADVIREFQTLTKTKKGNISPKSAMRNLDPSACDAWTPRRMLFDKAALERRSNCNLLKLRDLTEEPRKRSAIPYSRDKFFISVLHIIGEGILDIPAIKSHKPITPGLPVEPGEVIFSRINPRIPRVAVVPDLGKELLCSSEYEIIRPRKGFSAYLLAFLLLSPLAQSQIKSLTAGTSASHSRVKPKQIYDILIPNLMLEKNPHVFKEMERYERNCKKMTLSLIEIEHVRRTLESLI